MANANDVILIFTDAAGTERTLTCDLNDVTYTSARDITSTATFCATSKSPGNLDISLSVAGLYNDADNKVDEVFDGLKRDTTPRLYKYYPAGSGTGATVYSGLSYLTNYEIGGAADGQVEVSAEFEVDGDDFRTTL